MPDAARSYGSTATERLLAEAFAETATITARAAARVLGLDEKTLRAMAEGGVIRSVVAGAKTRRYTEDQLRAWLAGERFGEVRCRPKKPGRSKAAPHREPEVADIVDLHARRVAAAQKERHPRR